MAGKITYLNIAEHYLNNTQNDSSPGVSPEIAHRQGYELNEITPPVDTPASA
jgi:hypothetical protein